MMLYVFHVDVGRMMSFDMTIALSSVENLKETIERLHGIPASNIVLLVSGGEMLTESTQVSYYSAGTDTNPIYMFLTGEAKVPPSSQQTDTDLDLRDQVERSMELPAVYDTVTTRTQLASKMYDHAREEQRLCERLVHDQHLQQQGWSAVVANMEDLNEEFRLRLRNFCTFFDRQLGMRSGHLELLRNFNSDLQKLSRIPILPGLMSLAEAEFHGFDEYLDNDDIFSRSHNQQQSVLMTGAPPPPSAPDNTKTETTTARGDGDTCDPSSTSPNKKPKMSEHEVTATAAAKEVENSGSGSGGTKEGIVAALIQSGAMRRNKLNLLQWITSRENHNALQTMCAECVQGLGTFQEDTYEKLKNEYQNIIKIAEQSDVKEIKGLGERLCQLEEFMHKIKEMVKDQKELSTAFQHNQNRAINLRDPSILPDLCASHRSQLAVMLHNHKKILEHRRCIAKAKDELGSHLHMRLSQIVRIENAMSDFDNRLLFYHRCLRRAERHISIIEQIHQAPCIYVAAVTEVVRRKIFSEEFGTWASKLIDDFDVIHREEIKRRELFNANFDGHFLNILFPGMNDMPPTFANENPLTFDARLPNLTRSDIEVLSSYLPDLATEIQLPDMAPVIRFFVSRSGEHQKVRWEQLLKEQEDQDRDLNSSNMEKPQNLRLTELQKEAAAVGGGSGGGASGCSGCDESETDTEIEFEKVSSTAVAPTTDELETANAETTTTTTTMLSRSTTTERPLMTSAETLTEENETGLREEVERLRKLLSTLSHHSLECIRLARSNLGTFRTDAQSYREDLQSDIQSLQDTCKVLRMQCEAREQELLQDNLSKDLELETLRLKIRDRDEDLETFQLEIKSMNLLQEKFNSLQAEMDELRQEFNRERDTAVARAREELIHEHKTEIESLRCRFKLMTSMERSPSDMSLEKIEKPIVVAEDIASGGAAGGGGDMIDLKQHEAIRAQLKVEKDRAVSAAVEAERSMWQSKITLNSESVMANVGILKVIEEKERQLEQLRERELMLTKENFQLKTRLDALTNEDAHSWLKEKIEYLNRDKERLEKELEKSRKLDMEASFAGARGGPSSEHTTLSRSKSNTSSHKYAVLQSLEKGNVVFAVWSTTYGQYIVVQDSQSLFFVHGDSLPSLKLRLPRRGVDALAESPNACSEEPLPLPFYALGVVLEKEYCQARKDENRYRVPRGSKFYRVKMAPLAIAQPSARIPRDRLESVSRSQSQCESQSEASSTAPLAGITLAASLHPANTNFVTSTTSTILPTSPDKDKEMDTVDAFNTKITISTDVSNRSAEEEEPVSLLSERCRYISVSEEEELSVTTTMTTNSPTTALQHQQSVITEQPTASNNLKLDLILKSSNDPNKNSDTAVQQITTTTTTSDPIPNKETDEQKPQMNLLLDPSSSGSTTSEVHIPATVIPTPSFGTTSEDSDEYRSLEGKEDETEYAMFD